MSRNRVGTERGGISFDYAGPQGVLVENEMLGLTPNVDKDDNGSVKYQQWDDALQFVRENQRGEPSDPSARFANDLHATIAEMLDLDDYSRLKYYTAVGSALDKYHSIDGFFEFQVDPENPKDIVCVTFDLTTNPNKNDYKADFVIYVPAEGIDPKEDKEDYAKLLKDNAKMIAARFKPYCKEEAVA